MEKVIIGEWRHSREENKEGSELMHYRPADFDFPPARGREGFKILADGKFENLPIAPNDGFLSQPGTWFLEKNVLRIELKNKESIKYQIQRASKDLLILKSIP